MRLMCLAVLLCFPLVLAAAEETSDLLNRIEWIVLKP